MRVIWDLEEATGNQVVEALAGNVEWKPATVHTLLRRLTQKKALGFEKRGREYVFRSLVAARECEREEGRMFLERVFGGQLAPFLATFVESEDFSAEEIEELKKILEQRTSKS